jgi:hypothetical protein
MSEQSDRPSEVLGALPHRRPSRRSEKRAVAPTRDAPGKRPAAATRDAPKKPPAATTKISKQRPAAATKPSERSPLAAPSSGAASTPPRGTEIVGTAVQAAAELAEIGLSVTARAIREAVARLPRP